MIARGLRILGVAFAMAAGCRVPAVEGTSYVGPGNACTDRCPGSGRCVDGVCVAEATTYPLLLEVTAPAATDEGTGVPIEFPVRTPLREPLALQLPGAGRIRGTLDLGGPIPIKLRLERVDADPSSATRIFETSSPTRTDPTVAAEVPPGNYVVTAYPTDPRDQETVPPIPLREGPTAAAAIVPIGPGSLLLRVTHVGGFRTVDLAFTDGNGAPLVDPTEARDVYVVDDTTGMLASSIARTCVEPGAPLRSEVTLRLSPTLAGRTYTLRVDTAARPCSAAAPKVTTRIEWDLQSLDVSGGGDRIQLALPRTGATLITGFVRAFASAGTGRPLQADVVLRSVTLAPEFRSRSGRISIEARARTSSEGFFAVRVVPGTYRADVIPLDVRTDDAAENAYAICVDCTIPSQDPSARPGTRTAEFELGPETVAEFELAPRTRLLAKVVGFDASSFETGSFSLRGSLWGTGNAASGRPLLVRPQRGELRTTNYRLGTGEDGLLPRNVAATLDPGRYDLVARTPPESGLPWIVRSQVEIPPGPVVDLGELRASTPVVLTGVVRHPSGTPARRAWIRARALLGSPERPIGSATVGETRTDDEGRFRLIVPEIFAGALAE